MTFRSSTTQLLWIWTWMIHNSRQIPIIIARKSITSNRLYLPECISPNASSGLNLANSSKQLTVSVWNFRKYLKAKFWNFQIETFRKSLLKRLSLLIHFYSRPSTRFNKRISNSRSIGPHEKMFIKKLHESLSSFEKFHYPSYPGSCSTRTVLASSMKNLHSF